MDLAQPFRTVTTSLDGPVLAALARSGTAMSGREVHRACERGSPAGVQKVLERLARQGVVTAERRAAATLWTLNRRHLAAVAIETLARIPETLVEATRSTVLAWHAAPLHASLFGSFVSGTADEGSDVDLFLVAPARPGEEWDEQVVSLQGQVRAMTGNDLAVLEWSPTELRANRATPLVRGIVASHLHLAGDRLAALVSGAA